MELDTIVVGDCLDVMRDMPDGCVDLVVADPPYGLGFWNWVNGWIELLPRILKPTTSIYVFCGIGEKADSFTEMYHLIKENFTFKNLITWKKQRGYGTQRNWMYIREELIFAVNSPDYIFNPQYGNELRTKFTTGKLGKIASSYKPKSDYKRVSNVWIDIKEISPGVGNKAEWTGKHPSQKPLELIERIIKASSCSNDLIFDPFIGSGTTAVAALKLGRHFYGCDINPEYVKLANERIEKTRLEMSQIEMVL
jgi:site-specific DNA-methyltransferase (adenine-specific)